MFTIVNCLIVKGLIVKQVLIVNFYLLLQQSKRSFIHFDARHSLSWVLFDSSCIDTCNIYYEKAWAREENKGA